MRQFIPVSLLVQAKNIHAQDAKGYSTTQLSIWPCFPAKQCRYGYLCTAVSGILPKQQLTSMNARVPTCLSLYPTPLKQIVINEL